MRIRKSLAAPLVTALLIWYQPLAAAAPATHGSEEALTAQGRVNSINPAASKIIIDDRPYILPSSVRISGPGLGSRSPTSAGLALLQPGVLLLFTASEPPVGTQTPVIQSIRIITE